VRTFPPALLIWALLFAGTCTRSAKVQGPQTHDMTQKAAPLTLTNDQPTGSFVVSPDITAKAPPAVEFAITQVVNPSLTSFEILVYLAPQGKKGDPEPEKILVGNFSLYPSDHPAKFSLSSANAFRKVRASAAASDLKLVVELKHMRANESWSGLKVTIDPPRWLEAEPK
jgi:hypothetical protein